MHCSSCTGVFHPATGHQWSEKTRLCLRCARNWHEWLKGHTNRRWGKIRFYEHTETSRRVPQEEPMRE
jgi:hypothetical protein